MQHEESSRPNGLTAAVFDLDGTLIDTAPGLQRVINRMLAKAGLPPLDLETVKHTIGGRMEDMVEVVVRTAGGDLAARPLADWAASYLAELAVHDVREDAPFPGVPEVLGGLRARGVKLAVCTNKRQAAATRVLSAQKLLGLFDVVLGEDALDGFRKPDPRHLRAVLKSLGAPAGQAVMVGDHANDFNCARGAGVPVVLCSYGYSPVPVAGMGADAVIADFRDLPATLEKI